MVVAGCCKLQLRLHGVDPALAGQCLQVQRGHDQDDQIPRVLIRVADGLDLLARRPEIPQGAEINQGLRRSHASVKNAEWTDQLRHTRKTGETKGGQIYLLDVLTHLTVEPRKKLAQNPAARSLCCGPPLFAEYDAEVVLQAPFDGISKGQGKRAAGRTRSSHSPGEGSAAGS